MTTPRPANGWPSEPGVPTRHFLKTWPEFFQEVLDERKAVEVRHNDRNYRVGDELELAEYDPRTATHSGRSCIRLVTHVLGEPWMQPGTVAMSIKPLVAASLAAAVKGAREKGIRDVAALVDKVLATDLRDKDTAQTFAARMRGQIKALLATPKDGEKS